MYEGHASVERGQPRSHHSCCVALPHHAVGLIFLNHFVDGLPYLDKIIYQNVQDKTAKRIGLRRNQFQLARTDSVMRFSDIREFSKLEHLTLTEYQGISGGAIVLEFNTRREPLNNLAVRQAIAYAVKRDHISNVLHYRVT